MLLVMMPAGLKAQATEYVTDVMVIGDDSSGDVEDLYESKYQPYGWKLIDYDLNKGAGGHDIYLLYKTGTDVTKAISDLYFFVSDNNTSTDSFTLNGRTYTRADYDGDDDFIASKGDLNKGASGKYIYLYYTKDNTNLAPARAITSITINDASVYSVGPNGNVFYACDLNDGTGSDDHIYMHITRTATSTAPADISTEAELREAFFINNANVRLTADITTNMSKRLPVFDGMNITVDLNDHTLSSQQEYIYDTGHVLQVHKGGTLTLKDTGAEQKGRVTGGWAYDGGGVWVEGNFIFEGGTISGNKAQRGAGIYITPEGTVTMTGGTITGNNASNNGGGIYNMGTLNMEGSPVVEGNIVNNVYLFTGAVVSVTGAFSADARVGVTTLNSDVVITSGYVANNPSAAANAYLYSDSGLIFSIDNGEVKQAAPTDNWLAHRSSKVIPRDGKKYYIENEADLARLAYDVVEDYYTYRGCTFYLNKDLDMSGHEWTPIGNAEHPFKGNFDGQGHTISGIWINNTDEHVGLFGYVKGTIPREDEGQGSDYIKNLVLTNANVTGGRCVGGVVGYVINQVHMQNIVCQANVTGKEHVGGVFGRAEGRTVSYWAAMAGLCDSQATIENCHLADGIITARNDVGVIVGSTWGPVDIKTCYYGSPVSAHGNSNEVRAYPITTKNLPTGVTIDYTSNGFTFQNLRYAPAGTVNFKVNNTDISQRVCSVKVNGTEVGTSTGSYSFTLDPNNDYEITVESVATTDMAGDGTQASPYQITTTEHWNHIAYEVEQGRLTVAKYFELCADIQVATMLGTADHPFMGHFDGKKHTLTISYGSDETFLDAAYAAPFRYVNGGSFKDLHVTGDIYTSAKFAAGIVGSQSGTVTIENCRSSVAIHSYTAGDGSHGGLVGLNRDDESSNLTITGCLFDGRLLSEGSTLTTNCGGFIGWRAGSANIYSSFFDPAEVTVGDTDGATFARGGGNTYNSYYTYLLCDGTNNVSALTDGSSNPKKYSNGQQAYPVTGVDGVTVAIHGNATITYDMSGLNFYGDGFTRTGISTIYAAKGDNVQIDLGGSTNGYIASDGTLTKTETYYTLIMGINTYIMSMFEAPTTIASAEDWVKFCWKVNNGTDYSGLTVTMTADIGTAEHPVTFMAGASDHKFKGTFDGSGHTLTFAATDAEEFCAPFRFVDGATIKNLHTTGTISTSNMKAAGIVAEAKGTSAITNCRSNMEILSRRNGDGTHGGLVGIINDGSTTIEGSLFYGKLLGSDTNKCGGFVGWTESNNGASVTINNSLFIPESITIKDDTNSNDDNATFSRGRGGHKTNITVTNSYYSEALGTKQGNEIVYYTESKTAPANIGTKGTFHSVSLITEYTNGLKFGNDQYSVYLMTPEAVTLANATDNSTTISTKDGYFANVTLTDRTLYKDGNWNTLCLPFDVVLDDSPLKGATARPLSEASIAGTTLTLTFGDAVTALVAGTPYLIKWTKPDGYDGHESNFDISAPVFESVIISKTMNDVTSSDGKVTFKGTYAPVSITEETGDNTKLFLGAANTLYWPNSTMSIGCQRAYFQLNNGLTAGEAAAVRSFVLNFGGGEDHGQPTGIVEAEANRFFSTLCLQRNSSLFTLHSSLPGWYTLDGRKIVNGQSSNRKLPKGVYIHNGRKVVMK